MVTFQTLPPCARAGTGKTLLSRAIASNIDANFLKVILACYGTCCTFLNKWLSSPEPNAATSPGRGDGGRHEGGLHACMPTQHLTPCTALMPSPLLTQASPLYTLHRRAATRSLHAAYSYCMTLLCSGPSGYSRGCLAPIVSSAMPTFIQSCMDAFARHSALEDFPDAVGFPPFPVRLPYNRRPLRIYMRPRFTCLTPVFPSARAGTGYRLYHPPLLTNTLASPHALSVRCSATPASTSHASYSWTRSMQSEVR
jgi:hypothetical protein